MFIICGSGRSGTSAVGRLLHEAGLPLGHDLVEADENNAEGYYEERPLIHLNDLILKAAGLGPWFTSATRDQILEAAAPYADDMRELLATATPAWKDPRFSWTLEPWLDLLPESPRVIVCLRSPSEVVASAMKYYGQVTREAGRAIEHVWRTQNERLLEVIGDYALDAICIEYAALHADPARAIEPLARFVGRTLDASLVRQDLRHHNGARVPPRLRKLYERVRHVDGGLIVERAARPSRRRGGAGGRRQASVGRAKAAPRGLKARAPDEPAAPE